MLKALDSWAEPRGLHTFRSAAAPRLPPGGCRGPGTGDRGPRLPGTRLSSMPAGAAARSFPSSGAKRPSAWAPGRRGGRAGRGSGPVSAKVPSCPRLARVPNFSPLPPGAAGGRRGDRGRPRSAREPRAREVSAPARLRTSAPSAGAPGEAAAWAFPLAPKRASAVAGHPAGAPPGSPSPREVAVG